MAKSSAGLLVYRRRGKQTEVFLIHPGGPFWQNKDEHSWSIPKGEPEQDEPLIHAAQREFEEETGLKVNGNFQELTPVRQSSEKIVYAWAVETNLDHSNIKSNLFWAEWPPHSGKKQQFPEVDKADWFVLEVAKLKIHKGQVALLEELEKLIPD